MHQIQVTQYDPAWPLCFEQLRDRIWPAIADYVKQIEHVGSTSVLGLAAKPIIDMTIVVRSEDEMPAVIGALEGLGYRHRGDLGITGREAFHHPPDLPAHHLYVCVDGALALRNHLAVRDLLRSDPQAMRAYGQLKLKLAQEHPDDIDAYIAAKTPMLLDFLKRAGLSPKELAEIDAINTTPADPA